MTRTYYGDINGKFWDVQSSDDATHFGVEPTLGYAWECCGQGGAEGQTECPNGCKDCVACKTPYPPCLKHWGQHVMSLDEEALIYRFTSTHTQTMTAVLANLIAALATTADDEKREELLARIELGSAIAECLGRTGACSFVASCC